MLSQQRPCSRLCYIIHVCVIKHRQLAPAAAIPKQQVAGSASNQQLPTQQRKAVELLAANCGREAVSRGGLGVCMCGCVDKRAGNGDRSGAPAASAATTKANKQTNTVCVSCCRVQQYNRVQGHAENMSAAFSLQLHMFYHHQW